MARSSLLSILCAAVLIYAIGNAALSFVSSPGVSLGSTAQLRSTAQRMPGVALEARGGDDKIVESPDTYIIGFTVFFFASIAANVSGFFGPW